MGFWEYWALLLTSAGTFASILGIFYAYASRRNGRETRSLIRSMKEDTGALIGSMKEDTQEFIRSMEEEMRKMLLSMQEDAHRSDEGTRTLIRTLHEETQKTLAEIVRVLERMDMRADERHLEVIEAIKALKA